MEMKAVAFCKGSELNKNKKKIRVIIFVSRGPRDKKTTTKLGKKRIIFWNNETHSGKHRAKKNVTRKKTYNAHRTHKLKCVRVRHKNV